MNRPLKYCHYPINNSVNHTCQDAVGDDGSCDGEDLCAEA